MQCFKDKVALVTGAASGIGRATASAFAKVGAHVVVADWNQAQGEETVRFIQEQGGKAYFIYMTTDLQLHPRN